MGGSLRKQRSEHELLTDGLHDDIECLKEEIRELECKYEALKKTRDIAVVEYELKIADIQLECDRIVNGLTLKNQSLQAKYNKIISECEIKNIELSKVRDKLANKCAEFNTFKEEYKGISEQYEKLLEECKTKNNDYENKCCEITDGYKKIVLQNSQLHGEIKNNKDKVQKCIDVLTTDSDATAEKIMKSELHLIYLNDNIEKKHIKDVLDAAYDIICGNPLTSS